MKVAASLTLPTTAVGQKASSTITISNTGKQSISNANPRVSDGDTQDFSVNPSQCSSIQTGGSCTATVTFAPTAQGTRWASLLITSDASNSPRSVYLTGEGGSVSASLSAPTLPFGNQDTGSQSAASSVTLTNTGTESLTISGITSSADFPQTNTCGSSLAAAASCQISVQFAPSNAGAETGTLTVTDNAGTQTVALSGTGTTPTISIGATSGASLSNTVAQGKTASYALALIGSAGFNGTVSLICSGAPQYAACTLSPSSVAVTPGSNNPFSVTVTTQTTSPAAQVIKAGVYMPLGMLVLCLVFPRRFRKSIFHVGACVVALIGFASLSGCGGGGRSSMPPAPTVNYTPAGTYTLTLTAASGTTNSTQSLTLLVQ